MVEYLKALRELFSNCDTVELADTLRYKSSALIGQWKELIAVLVDQIELDRQDA